LLAEFQHPLLRFCLMTRRKPDPNLPDSENNRLYNLRKARAQQRFEEYVASPRRQQAADSAKRRNRLMTPQSVARRKREIEQRENPPVKNLPPPRRNAVPQNVVNELPPPRPSKGGKKSWDLPRPGQYLVPDIPHGINPRKPLRDPKPSDKPKKGTYVPPPPDNKKQNKVQLWWLK